MLNDNVCRFVSTGSAHNELVMLNFVHEKNWHETVPQLTAAFILHLVTAGHGSFTLGDTTPIRSLLAMFSVPFRRRNTR